MSLLNDVKNALRQTHNDDDDLLFRQIQSACYECVSFLNVNVESDQDVTNIVLSLPPSVANGVILMVQADYEGNPIDRDKLRRAAEGLWQPHRALLGV
jgi:two-component SAPR family response regulator